MTNSPSRQQPDDRENIERETASEITHRLIVIKRYSRRAATLSRGEFKSTANAERESSVFRCLMAIELGDFDQKFFARIIIH